MTRGTPRPFTPSRESGADLERRTVGRDGLLSILNERLAAAASGGSRPHTLLVGPRGSGKTHLIRVALHRLGTDARLRSRFVTADIPEDVVGITRYADLVREIATAMRLSLPRESGVVAMEDAILEELGDRTLLLVLENVDRLFRSLGTPGQQDLRSWVETSGRVLILGAAPMLFSGVKDRGQPWFAGMISTPVDGLRANEGRELLTRLAQDAGDDRLADFLTSERGGERIDAVAALTGGSPRIWMVLSECLTVENLDALVPAVERLVEGLVPYYQQVLWDLPDHQQAIVRQLAEGASAALTAAEIAAATGQSQQTVSKALLVLQEGRWVRSEKMPSDRRRTWYSLREPMLRHHFQWRGGRTEPLTLIVEILRGWYAASERRRHLARSAPLSPAEVYLAESLRLDPPSVDLAYAYQDADELLGEARRWIVAGDDVFTRECGRYVEACVLRSQDPVSDPRATLSARPPTAPTDDLVATTISSCGDDDIGRILARCSAALGPGATATGLALVAAGWIGSGDPHEARGVLADSVRHGLEPSPTRFAALVHLYDWTARCGHPDVARGQVEDLLPAITESLGVDHDVTLTARGNLASYTGETGDPITALTLYRDLLPDVTRVLGPDHPHTLATRAQLAYYTGQTGDPTTALTLYRDLLTDTEHVLGADHRHTLAARAEVASYTGETGDPATALTLYHALLTDTERVLGPDHPTALAIRAQAAYLTGRTGDPATALTLYRDLLTDTERVLGPDHPDTLNARWWVAACTGRTGDPATALTLYRDLLTDTERVLGPNHPQTRDTRWWVAVYTGDLATALNISQDALTDTEPLLGPTHRLSRLTRSLIAELQHRLGNPDAALATLADGPASGPTLVRVLEATERPPASELLSLMWRALRGDEEAELRLPQELREIVGARRLARDDPPQA